MVLARVMLMSSFYLGNTIAPLVFAAGVQLLVGNFLIGLLEAAVVRLLFRGKGRLVPIAVLANYVSLFAAFVVLPVALPLLAPAVLGDQPLHRLGRLVTAVVAACFLVSVLVEWPLFHAGLRRLGGERPWTPGASLAATLAAQAASYLLLVPFYLITALQTPRAWQLTRPADFASHPAAAVLFLSPDGSEVRHVRLDGSGETALLPSGGPPPWAFLRLVGSSDGKELSLRIADSVEQRNGYVVLVPRTLAGFGATLPATRPYWSGGSDDGPDLPGVIRDAVDLQPDARVPWEPRRGRDRTPASWDVRASPLPSRGLSARRPGTGEDARIAVDVPGASWGAYDATVLPGGQVVFELGGQVLLADLNTKKLATLARGRSPVVLLDGMLPPTPTSAPATPVKGSVVEVAP